MHKFAFTCLLLCNIFRMVQRVGDLHKYLFNQNFNKVSLNNPVSLKGTFLNKRKILKLNEYKNMFLRL